MTYQYLWHSLTGLYDESEAKAVVRLLLASRFGMSLTDIAMGKVEQLPAADEQVLEGLLADLKAGRPVQYVLGESWFCGRRFHVGQSVLIPRPETEELCRYVIDSLAHRQASGGLNVLDIGTGSGCIAVTLAAELPNAAVEAWDLSEEALAVARHNAILNGVLTPGSVGRRGDVCFRQIDALNAPDDTECWDVIVSNPPYVCEREKNQMRKNVLDFEPHIALFVPDDDPLRFYRSIGRYARKALKPGGQLFFEINEHFANEMELLLQGQGFTDVIVFKDQFGKDRCVRACR